MDVDIPSRSLCIQSHTDAFKSNFFSVTDILVARFCAVVPRGAEFVRAVRPARSGAVPRAPAFCPGRSWRRHEHAFARGVPEVRAGLAPFGTNRLREFRRAYYSKAIRNLRARRGRLAGDVRVWLSALAQYGPRLCCTRRASVPSWRESTCDADITDIVRP